MNKQPIIQWAKDRNIIPQSNSFAQALKTHEELGELLQALYRHDREQVIDAYGDILITLIIGAELAHVDLDKALEHAYDQIKDRKGWLRSDGIFVKDINDFRSEKEIKNEASL